MNRPVIRTLRQGDIGHNEGYRFAVLDYVIGEETFWHTYPEAERAANLPENIAGRRDYHENR